MNRHAAIPLWAFLVGIPLPLTAEEPPEVPSLQHSNPVQAIVVAQNSHIYAGTFGGGVYRSMDEGETWTDRNVELSDKEVFALATNSQGVVFAGTFGGGVFRFDDSLNHWKQRNAGLMCTEVISLEVGPDDILYAGTSSNGVYSSADDGDTWTPTGLDIAYISTIAVNGNGDVLVGTQEGIQISTDRGRNWRRANHGLGCRDVWAIAILANGDFFAATNGGGVYHSQDHGLTWVPANTGLASKHVGSLVFCPKGDLFAGTANGVFCSSDNGVSWEKVKGGFAQEAVGCLRMSGGGHIITGTIKGNIFRSKSIEPVPEDLGEAFEPVAMSD